MSGEMHGKRNTRLYKTWDNMKQRCNNPNKTGYHRYGGRDIKVCKSWSDSFITFYNWAMSHGYRDDLQVDRIDNDGNYAPDNCQFITLCENVSKSKSPSHTPRKPSYLKSVRYITFQGQTRCIAEWARYLNICDGTLRNRLDRYGWSVRKAFTTPIGIPGEGRISRYIEYQGERLHLAEWARRLGVGRATLKARLDIGMPVNEAFTKSVRGVRLTIPYN